jgi:hypothetical protein
VTRVLWWSPVRGVRRLYLDRVADRTENRGDLVAQEDQRQDGDDRDQGEDEGVFRETLTLLSPADRRAEVTQHRMVPLRIVRGREVSAPSQTGFESDRSADLAQDRADLVAQEDQRQDGDDRDQGEDQRVLRETLALVIPAQAAENSCDQCHS